MAEPTDPWRTVACPGTISRALTGIAECLKRLFISLLFSILIEWIGVVFCWEEQRLDHSHQMLVNELQSLGVDFNRGLLTVHPMQFAKDISGQFYQTAFEWIDIVELIQWVIPVPSAEESGIRPVLHRVYQPASEFVLSAVQITQVFAVRLAVLALAIPAFGLFTLVALVDGGLVQRDL